MYVPQEREEREEIEKELRAQNEAFMAATVAAAGGSSPLSHLSGLNIPGLMSTATDNNGNSGGTANKEPPPLGLAGLEAFRREYLTSPLSHMRSNNPNLVPSFPGLLPQLGDRSPFNKTHPSTPQHLSGGGGGSRTPPTSSQSTPSSEFSSQQNWSFEEQFKQVKQKLPFHQQNSVGRNKMLLAALFSPKRHFQSCQINGWLTHSLSARRKINPVKA